MDVEAARYLGAGLASIALIGAGVGIGIIFGNYLSGALRNPGAAAGQFTNLLVVFALCAFTGLLGVVMCLIILCTSSVHGRSRRNNRRHCATGGTCRLAADKAR